MRTRAISAERPKIRGQTRWLSVGGSLLGLTALAWIFARLDYGHLGALVADALALVPLARAHGFPEHWVRLLKSVKHAER